MKKTIMTESVLYFFGGFFGYAAGLVLIFSLLGMYRWICFWTTLIFTFSWLYLYTRHVANIAIRFHEEALRKKNLPNTKDLNEDVDKMIFKHGKGQCLKM